jgi:hypothetical protein
LNVLILLFVLKDEVKLVFTREHPRYWSSTIRISILCIGIQEERESLISSDGIDFIFIVLASMLYFLVWSINKKRLIGELKRACSEGFV